MSVFFALLALALPLLYIQVRFALKKRRLFGQTWDDILTPVEAVDLNGLQEIADLYLNPSKDQFRIEPNEMWNTVGGFAGIQRLRANAKAMLALAMYPERWNCEKSVLVSEVMRNDAFRLNKCLNRVEFSTFYGIGKLRAPLALQEAVASYCLMRGRLLGLYNVAHIGKIPLLEATL